MLRSRSLTILATIVLAVLTSRTSWSCDTWVALPDVTTSGSTILAKNSDRPVFDCQPLVFHPRAAWPAGIVVDAGRISIPQVSETYATIGSSPYWCWGYEEGINEFGVAIGNEGIATRVLIQDLAASADDAGPDPGLTGMDLLRLGLERGRTAREALDVITSLLEQHGQFGSGLPTMNASDGAYHNSYIIADPREAWILETAGRHWVARCFRTGSTSISNTPTIGARWDLASPDLVSHAANEGWWPQDSSDILDFTRAYGDDSPLGQTQRSMSLPRAACSNGLLFEKQGAVDPRWMMRIARDESSSPPINLDKTASSCVAVLPNSVDELPVFWWCPAVPGDSCYVPFFVHGSGLPEFVSAAGTEGNAVRPPSEVAPDAFAPESYWWIFRDLHEKASSGVSNRTVEVREAFDTLEREFENGLPVVIEQAVALREAGHIKDASHVLDAYTESCLDRAIATANELRQTMSGDDAEEIPPQLVPYIGRYETTYKREVHSVVVRGGRLAIDVPGQTVYELLEPDASGRRQFALTDLIAVSFVHDDTSAVIGMVYHQASMDLELWREGHELPSELDAEEVSAFLGQYRFEPANLDATVLIGRGRLAVDVKGQMIFVLRRGETDGTWIARATDLIVVTFQTGEDGEVVTMTMEQAGQPVVFQRVTSEDDGG